jgi:hypothetical protein
MNTLLTWRSAALLALVAAMPAAAQTKESQRMDEAAVRQSRAIQTHVAEVTQDKETFINNLIASWVPNVDAQVFGDISSELRPLMEAATPWRLYAASLVGDYNGMIQVLRGEVPAARVINTLSKPQVHGMVSSALTVGALSPFALGSTTSQLVFTPIPPCRVADTRSAGARTGILAGGVPRTFDLTTDGFSKGQGGNGPCPGLPSFSNYGWSINITATGYNTSGYVQVFPFGGSVPATSILNYGTALSAIANSSTVTGCYGCADDINVLASTPAHIVLDVYGYFELPTGFATGAIAITKLAGTTETVAPGVYQRVDGAGCPAGTVVVGGAQTNNSNSSNTVLTSDHNISGTNWYEYVKNTGGAAATVTVYSICEDVS